MQSRDTRFTLRIESGDRQGEEIPLPEGNLLVGRRPESGLVLKDASVSGRHAEVRVRGAEVEVLDLGSTNGTRVDGHKIEQARLAHGDAVLFGNVRLVLRDAQMGGMRTQGPSAAPARAPSPAASDSPEPSPEIEGLDVLEDPVGAAGPARGDGGTSVATGPLAATALMSAPPVEAGGLGRISADKVTRSAKRSRLVPVVLGLALLAGGGAFAYLRFLRPGPAAGPSLTVPALPGNRVADGSFEEGGQAWSAAEAAPQAFLADRAYAKSGALGLGVVLEDAGWSLASSEEFELHARRRVELTGELQATGATRGRLGLELASADGTQPRLIAWAPAVASGDSFRSVALGFDALGGYDRGRVVVAGLGRGTLALDDVGVLEVDPKGDAARFNEYELSVLGSPGSTAALVRSGRVVLAGFELSAWGREGLTGWPEAHLAASATERGFQLSFAGAPAEAELRFEAVRAAAAGNAPEETGWVATTGPDGYAAHGGEFTRANVTSLLLGRGLELLRLGFAKPVQISGAGAEGVFRVRVALGGLEECEFQLTFHDERAEAAALAQQAEQRERAGDPGGALTAWSELLDRFPFERELVTRAEAARARLVAAGLAEVEAVRRGLERARFFALPELFRQGRTRAQALAQAYRGSEVEAEATAAAAQAEGELTALTSGQESGAARRLEGVLRALDAKSSPRLTELVKGALAGVDQESQGN